MKLGLAISEDGGDDHGVSANHARLAEGRSRKASIGKLSSRHSRSAIGRSTVWGALIGGEREGKHNDSDGRALSVKERRETICAC